MKTRKIIGIGAACFVVLTIAIIITNSLGGVIENQQERNYQRFVTNVDGLTNTFRQPVEVCAQEIDEIQQKQCLEGVIEEFQIQFGTLIKLFGYEPHIEELYYLWKADLDFWFDSKNVELQYSDDTEFMQSEIQRLSEIRQKAIDSRLEPSFAQRVESGQ